MSACRVASFVSGPVIRCALLGLLVAALLTAACLSASGGDAGQKVAAALEETWLVVALLVVHLVVSRLRGDAPPKPHQKKAGAALEERGCEAAFAPAPGGAAARGAPSGDDALRAQAIGKLTTRVRTRVQAGDMLGAEESMRELREVGGAPGRLRRPCWAVAFGEVVSGYVREGSAAKASEWLGEFAACVPAIRPSTACVNSVIVALCASGDAASAEAWVERMPEIGIRVGEDTFSSLISGCLRAGDVPRGIRWLREMRKAKLRPSAELNSLMVQACAGDC
ncbi:unnamed protein product [Prorocentrum cordatum]|uniref:Pentatricopeptide repeat-containing protein n=1 Tax=Prorocentrum cordatum TaxID=2364126 RepID=A0ABN9U9Y6_9DINO|nr:unnamed protein product [Polarella glacialis]